MARGGYGRRGGGVKDVWRRKKTVRSKQTCVPTENVVGAEITAVLLLGGQAWDQDGQLARL